MKKKRLRQPKRLRALRKGSLTSKLAKGPHHAFVTTTLIHLTIHLLPSISICPTLAIPDFSHHPFVTLTISDSSHHHSSHPHHS
eukprot:1161319-Pelagomonas_calceolata.AAC.1